MISSVFLYLILIFTISYNTLNDDEVLCFVPDGFTGRGKDFWTLTQVVINISVIVVYAKLKNALKQQGILNSHVTRKIFKSLFMLVAFYICGWVVTITLLVATRVFVQE
ncbi:hypothetical protein L596_026818 [Steinernema carpocapsae]|uniref:G-protein coupled receptors family 1 profile domain-containing protein n=1 Tax=Steinernema carpocapsae TaxID=34508 RepID=A0A4U5M2J0_STECR|nr:hypothetical protein L596_026818 [Steinernema carpocapsae]